MTRVAPGLGWSHLPTQDALLSNGDGDEGEDGGCDLRPATGVLFSDLSQDPAHLSGL